MIQRSTIDQLDSPPTGTAPSLNLRNFALADYSLDTCGRIEFLAAVQKGLDQLDRGEGIPHDEIKKQLASWLKA